MNKTFSSDYVSIWFNSIELFEEQTRMGKANEKEKMLGDVSI